MRKLGFVPPQFAANTTYSMRRCATTSMTSPSIASPPTAPNPALLLTSATTLTGQTPRMAGSMVKLIMDRGGRQVQHGHLQADC